MSFPPCVGVRGKLQRESGLYLTPFIPLSNQFYIASSEICWSEWGKM